MNRGAALRIADYLGHMLQALSNIADYTAGITSESYLADNKTHDAVMRNIEVLGEASNNVLKRHAEFAATHAQIPWARIYAMRNALSHGYFSVDHEIVWRTTQHDLPPLRAQIETMLASLGQ